MKQWKSILMLACVFLFSVMCSFIPFGQVRTVMTSSEKLLPLPIIMYHSILKDETKTGKYVVTPDTLASDMVYLKNAGYETVTMSDVIAYVKNGEMLPEKPVVLTFDDGYRNNLTYLLPLLEEYDMKAVISVVGAYAKHFSESEDHNINYAHLTWGDMSTLVESGRVEIQNHSYDMHSIGERKGSMKMSTETMSQYRESFVEDALHNQTLLLENCGIVPNTYTYPYGRITTESVSFLEDIGFEAALTCYEYVNMLGNDESVLMSLGRFNRPGNIDTNTFMKRILP